jgi:hypothetical protein
MKTSADCGWLRTLGLKELEQGREGITEGDKDLTGHERVYGLYHYRKGA